MKIRKLSLINSLLIVGSSLYMTSAWGEHDMKEELNISSFVSVGATCADLESEFLSIGQTPGQMLNLAPKKVDILQGDACGTDFLLIERDVFDRLGKINNKADFYRLLKEEGKEVADFTQHFTLDPIQEDLTIPKEWQDVKGYPVPMRSRILGVVGNVALNAILGQVGAAFTHVASNYVIVNFGEPLAEAAARATIVLNHKVFNVIWPSQAQTAPNKSWFRGFFEKTTDNFEYTNTKAEMLRRIGGLSDTTVKYAGIVGQGLYSGAKSVASFTTGKISNWWNKKKA